MAINEKGLPLKLTCTVTHSAKVRFSVLIYIRWWKVRSVLPMQHHYVGLVDDKKQPRAAATAADGSREASQQLFIPISGLRLCMHPRPTHSHDRTFVHLHPRGTARGTKAAHHSTEQAESRILGWVLER
jgi:hypothetical protein